MRFCVSLWHQAKIVIKSKIIIKSVLTQIITFSVGGAFIVAKYAFLCKLEVSNKNHHFVSVFT